MGFSPRYPPVMGRLHTRYAPVRRSPAAYCYALLPLDLHVLGLPLAFILSQDQTLHCKNFSFFTFDSSCPQPRPSKASDTRYLLFHPFQCTVASSRLFNHTVFPSKASAKIQPFSKLTNFFSPHNGFSILSRCGTTTKKLKIPNNNFRFHLPY